MSQNDRVHFYSVVIPCFDTVSSVEELARRIRRVFESVVGASYELIFVDDGSPNPQTWSTLQRLAKEDPSVRAIRLMRNFGQQAATICGLEASRGDFVFTMDDDLQHLPEDIPKLISGCDHDIVVAEFRSKKHSFFKRMTSRIKGFFDALLIGKPKHVQLSSFRMLSRPVVDGMLSIYSPHPFVPALMFSVSRDVVGVAATHGVRSEGKTTYTLGKMIGLFLNLLINNSSLLLRVIGHSGLLMSSLSFLYGGVIVYQKLVYDTQQVGWSSLIVTLLMVGGLLLFSVGVIGEYLIRIIHAVEKKPMFWVRTRIG
jgi:dolichol-phosphate mannosyltransferase/undecaprenyl-phosphate 4-deoxy-4-formamido-L-arabinose transferase